MVATSGLAGEAMQVYYDARFVQRIAFEAEGVRIFYLEKSQDGKRTLRNIFHPLPPQGRLPPPTGGAHNVRRLSGLIDYRARGAASPRSPTLDRRDAVRRRGTTTLHLHRRYPHRDAVRARTASSACAACWIPRNPHTRSITCASSLRPAARRTRMQIGVHSSVGLDTTV